MKYNTIKNFQTFLEKSYSKTTADTYTKAIDFLLSNQYITDCKKFDINKVVERLENIKYKNQYSKYKNAFLKFCDFINIKLDDKTLFQMESMMNEKKRKRRNLQPVKLKNINHSINAIRDIKLKLSYKTMLNTGLRVSEISQIRKDDCLLNDDTITLHFVGKGGNPEKVTVAEYDDKIFFDRLLILIKSTDKGEKVFYSANYLQKNAIQRGFACHDLRRAFAKITYKEYKSMTKVMKLLRHKRIKNTKIYLKSKVII